MAAYAALVSLMHIIDNLENHPRPPISLHREQVISLTQKVTFLQKFLEGYNPNLGYSMEADPLESRIADAAYAAEDVIETHIVDEITNNGKNMSSDGVYGALEKVIEEMEVISQEAMGVNPQLNTKSTPPDSSTSSSSMAAQMQQNKLVGADDVLLKMKDKLASNCLALQVIPIVGMGGVGKTTLARNLYQDRLILEHFRILAWVTVSQEYSIRVILEQLVKQLLDKEESQNLSEGELGDILHKHLYGRKYLIVLDDMWTIRAWEGVKIFLPDCKNGSRIVVTTRLSNLASKLPNSSSLKMNLLDEDDSWDLLSKTVFGEKDCPLELEEIGKKIGKSCKGLPLSIVVVGGLLAKSTHTRKDWEYIEENLNSIVNLEDDERCLKILHMSYRQLPVHLKPCFLYMGLFPEDKVIRTLKIIRLWVVEGFLKPKSGKSLEEIAKEYLEELIGRNLVLIHKLGNIGSVKECKVHDLVRDLCLREAKKERFYTILTSDPTTPQEIGNNAAQRRIVVPSTTSMDVTMNALSSTPLARSLIWDLRDGEPTTLNLRLLRILESCSEAFVTNLDQSVNLRYLNIPVKPIYELLDSIWPFWNLQALYGPKWRVTAPTDFWCMPHIRHVQFYDLCIPCLRYNHNVLGNLMSLGEVRDFECSKQVVERIPNIKKLTIYYDEGICSDDRYCLTNIVCLDKLESLTCYFGQRVDQSGSDYLQRQINFPNSLKKLSMALQNYCWDVVILDKIGALPFLQKLKLDGGVFKEGQWETTDGQFRSLKFLSLHMCSGLRVWKTESSHFPILEHLRLVRTNALKEIPSDFAEISTLRLIDMTFCTSSAVVSAKRIVEEREESYGEEEAALRVQVMLRQKNEALENLASPNFHVTKRFC